MGILDGLRVVEVSAFIAAPLGAEVIRTDPPGSNIDIGRWRRTAPTRCRPQAER